MTRRFKIALLVSDFPPTTIGGTEIATRNIAKYLSKKHIDVHVITRTAQIKLKGEKRSLKKIESYNGYTIHRVPYCKVPIFRFITHVVCSLWTLQKIRPALIQGQMITPNGLIAVLGGFLLRKKTIVYARGNEVYESSLFYLKSLGQFVITRASVILGLSHDLVKRMKQLWPNKPIFQLSNGIELFNYYKDDSPKSTIELIYVGRLTRGKRVQDALYAISQVKNITPNIRLTIIGSGPEEDFLKRKCKFLRIEDHIRFLGKRPPKEIPKNLSKADIFIFPSHHESFGLAILEAMASYLPILASRSTAIPELVHDGENGLLHSPGNINELAKNLKTLIENDTLRKSMGKKSREIAQNYSWENIINKLIKIYFNMLIKQD